MQGSTWVTALHMIPHVCDAPPQHSPHHMDALWLLGKAVGVAAGCGAKVNGHHHEKRLLLWDGVSIILQVQEREWQASPSGRVSTRPVWHSQPVDYPGTLPRLTHHPGSLPQLTHHPGSLPQLTHHPGSLPQLTHYPGSLPRLMQASLPPEWPGGAGRRPQRGSGQLAEYTILRCFPSTTEHMVRG